MGEHGAQLIVTDATHEAGPSSKACQSGDGVRGRAARYFDGRPHGVIQGFRADSVDQGHAALDEAFANQEFIIGVR